MAKSKPSRKELKHDELVDAVFSLGLHLKKFSKIYLSLGALLLLGAIIVGATFYQRSQKEQQAARLLAGARSPEVLEEIYRDYPETKAAPLALLLLADIQYRQKKYQAARQSFGLFGEKYSQHEFAGFALMGMAYCQESEGKWEEAISGYEEVQSRFPQSFLVAEAIFNRGRCQARLGRPEIAREAYEEIINFYPRSPYARLALEQLALLKGEEEGKG